MKGMCGWIGGERDPILAKQITDAMVHAMTDEKNDTMLPLYSRCEGIAAWSKIDQASCHEVGSLKVAVVGNVYWENAELNELAQKESPAAAVAKAYSRSGKAFLEDMHGTFCVAVFNSQDGTVIAAIDRLGIYSICYAAPCGHFIFATSTDGVVAHPDMERVIDPQSIFNYLFFHSVPAPGSIYKNVRKLLPGQYALYQNGKVETNFYWHLKYADSGQSHFIQRQETLKKLLQTALRRSVTDEQVGAFLSGGTDSSTIAGVLAQSSTKTAHTFSIGFAAEGYDEMEFARITSKHFGTHAHEYYVTAQDVVDTIPLIARAYDEPFGNASAVPTYCCAKLAKEQGIRLMLAGDGGDEIFGGNARYAKQKIFEAYSLVPAMLRHSILEPAMFGVPGIEHIPLLRKLKSYIAQARVPLPDRLETYNFLHRTSPNEIFTADFLGSSESPRTGCNCCEQNMGVLIPLPPPIACLI